MNEIGGITEAMASDKDPELPTVKTVNDYIIGFGENLPNHSESMSGRGKYVRQMRADLPTFRNRHVAYRYAAYIITMAELLPEDKEQEGITFDDVLSAIQNT